MIRKILTLTLLLSLALPVLAKEEADSAYLAFRHHYYQLFDTDSIEAFHKISQQMQEYHKERGNLDKYYAARQNEVTYDSNHGRAYQAIEKANAILEDMKKDKVNNFDVVYLALGTIFESRGNYRMAVYYYQEALNNVDPKDRVRLSHVYSHLASAHLAYNTDVAWQWNERSLEVITPAMLDYKDYLVIKGEILFFRDAKEAFYSNKHKIDAFSEKNPTYHYGDHVIKIMEDAFNGNYEEALELLKQPSQDYDDIKRHDIRIRIYEMMGLAIEALRETAVRRDLRDSLNNDLIFDNLNAINAATGIHKLTEESSRKVAQWMFAVIVLLVISLVAIILYALTRKRYQERIERQNEKLERALDEAKESDRMKSIFIKHISHEIRTPLNIVTGYAHIIADTDYELTDEERKLLVHTMDENTIAITDIVNDLLEVSLEGSKERYHRDDTIAVNNLCRQVMKDTEEKNNGRLKLNFQTKLSDEFTIQSNKSGIERMLLQLLGNALKFTQKGEVELSVRRSVDKRNIYFFVTDTGIGIPEDQHEKVFEQFYKVDSFKQGMGIGLSMSRKIATLLGGTLTIDKDYHEGTRMILTIPIK